MKTPQNWLESVDFDWDEQVSVRMIEAIQQDAFESGWVAGRKYELDRIASILRDSGKPEMLAMAFSCERLSAGISQPPPTPPDNKKGGS